MTNLVLERMRELQSMESRPVRACEHVPAVVEAGAPYAMCGQHLQIGLFCEPCGLGHGAAMHGTLRCDYCGAEDLPDEAFMVPALGAFDALVLDVPGWPRDEPAFLLMPRFKVFGTPLVCERAPCVDRALVDLEETHAWLSGGVSSS